jgi:photosystem II stability/assembly factor-like uncharacterized protein
VVNPVTMAREAPPRVFEVISASDRQAPDAANRLNTSGAGRGGGLAGNFADGSVSRPLVRWRVTPASGVERSPDQGQTWEPVTLDPPFMLTAGSAPYQNVCWLVGQDGVVFRTTNGTSFERMTAPATVHLVRVEATDALRATVTAVDGRAFETIDGGRTWKPRG